MDQQISQDFQAGKFERTEEGFYFPRQRLLAQGVFHVSKRGEPVEVSSNLVMDQALDYILGVAVKDTSQIGSASWYVMPYSGNLTVVGSWIGDTVSTTVTEWTNYDEAARPDWQTGALASGTIDSFSTKASFTSSANTQTIYGAAIISVSTKGGSADGPNTILLAASNFASVKNLDLGEILDIGYGLTLTAV